MVAGVSTACLYPMNTEEALSLLAERRVESTEVFINSDSELQPNYLQKLRTTADAAGMQILSLHPYTSGLEPMLFFSGYHRRFEDGREYYRRYYDAANRLGAGIVVFHGNLAQFRMEPDEYADRFGALMADAAREGVRLCHENVCRCAGREPGFFRELSRRLPEAQYVLDIKQAVRSACDVYDFTEAMAGHIAHVHISDHTEEADCLSIGKGTFNIPQLLSTLRLQGFSGGLVVELYRQNFVDIVDLQASYTALAAEIRQFSTCT